MKVIVTGANGFLGTNLVKKLLELGHDVIAFTRSGTNISHTCLQNIKVDLNDINSLNIEKNVDALFHIAATVNFNNDKESIAAITNDNIISSYQLANFIVKHNINKVIMSSSCSVYQENFNTDEWITEESALRPQNLYATSKLASEWVLETCLNGLIKEFVILRYSSIYGFGQKPGSILPIFIQKATCNEPIKIFGSGNRVQDYVYVGDAVQANINCLNTELPLYSILNIGSGQPTTDEKLANEIIKIWDSSSSIEILNKNESAETIFNFDIKTANYTIGYQPMELKNGLQLYKEAQIRNL